MAIVKISLPSCNPFITCTPVYTGCDNCRIMCEVHTFEHQFLTRFFSYEKIGMDKTDYSQTALPALCGTSCYFVDPNSKVPLAT